MRSLTKTGLAVTALLTALGLVGCAPEMAAPGDGPIQIVASTNVYGDLAATIGGDRVEVTSVIDDPSQDPHSFEADARVQLALSKAHLVVANGGGYDPFIDQMLSSLDASDRGVIYAVELSPAIHHDADDDASDPAGHNHSAANEHVWYDIATVGAVTAGIRDALVERDPANGEEYTTNAQGLLDELGTLEERVSAMRDAGPVGVAVTEPVSLYLVEALGLHNVTPAAFSAAIEEGTEVSAATLNDTLRLVSEGDARILVYNDQTISPETQALKAAAEKAGAPIVVASEILPANTTYVEWMNGILDDFEAALETAR